MVKVLAQIMKAIVPILWGAAENRLWKEHGENFILNHFKTYHVFMAVLFGIINIIGLSFDWHSVGEWLFFMIYDPLILDVTWWVIRYFDYRKDYDKAVESYGEPNAWHHWKDWDNWLNPPLIAGFYWWWWVFTVVLIILGLVVTLL